MTGNTRIRNSNVLSQSKPITNRIDAIRQRTQLREWTLDSISDKLSKSQRDDLRETLLEIGSDSSNLPITSSEQLAAWGRTKSGKPYLGDLVMTNVPCVDIGAALNDRTRSMCEERGLEGKLPKHSRFAAFGITYGSVFLKMKFGTNKDGSRVVEELSYFVASNNALDLFLGKVGENGRSSDRWPPEWVSRVPPKPKRSSKNNINKDRARKHSSSILINTLHQVYGENKDPWKQVTLNMLKAVSKELGIEFSGRKAEQVSQLQAHLTSMGDSVPSDLLAKRLARTPRAKK